jgi:transcription elongation factor Elf1
MKKNATDFVLTIDELRKEGKLKISPISRIENSFNCPKCGNLISPENSDSYLRLGDKKSDEVLIRCKRCGARIKVLWKTDLSLSVCKQFK